MKNGAYAFDNDSVHARDQLSLLGTVLDPITRDRIDRLGIRPGWHCMEVGAGAGTIAEWMAEQVGPDGHVLATDINPRHLPSRDNLTTLRHDITTDQLPEKTYDLIHARLVLMHLPQRQAVLERLLPALKPGGTLLLDEFDCTYAPVLGLPDGADPTVFDTFNQALIGHLTSAGADTSFGRHCHRALGQAGYTHRDIETHIQPWPGGSPGCALHHSNSFHLQAGLQTHGITQVQLQALRTLLRDPAFIVSSYAIYSVSGRRRGAAGPIADRRQIRWPHTSQR